MIEFLEIPTLGLKIHLNYYPLSHLTSGQISSKI